MTKDIRDAIIEKQDELIEHLEWNIFHRQKGDIWLREYRKTELASLKAELNKPIAENTNPMSQMDNSPYEIVWNGIAYIRK